MKDQLKSLLTAAKESVETAESLQSLEDIRIKYLGKKGELTAIMKQMGKLSKEERPEVGKIANEVRSDIEMVLSEYKEAMKEKELEKQLEAETIDVTMPGKVARAGKRHPLNKVLDELKENFIGMGFKIAEGPEVDTVYNNFDALNSPKDFAISLMLSGVDDTQSKKVRASFT